MDKVVELQKIAEEIEKCKVCKLGADERSEGARLLDKRGVSRLVPGEGNANAKVVFIGEAPGKKEAETGRPFIGRSGQLLRSLIRGIGLKEEEVYITSPVKYLPEKGTPSESDIAHGKVHLEQQLNIIDPEIIVLLGSVAARGVLNQKIPVMKDHGKIIEKDSKKYFVTIHPAAVLRFAKNKPLLISDFEKLKNCIWNLKLLTKSENNL